MNNLKPFIIGETAYHHQGDIDYLYKIIDDIAQMGLDAVKFQILLDIESYMHKDHPLMKELRTWLFNRDQWDKAISYSRKKGLNVIVLCEDVKTLQYFNKTRKDLFAVELHARGLNDWFLLKEAAQFPGHVFLSIGGSSIEEIHFAVNTLRDSGKYDIVMMYGFQSYPTNYEQINLSKMLKLKNLFDLPLGYADHTAYNEPYNEVISVMAAMMGFNILEKHYTPEVGKERIDYHAAVGREQMLRIKELMALALKIYGNGDLRMSDAEIAYGKTGPMKKAIVAKRNINKGQKISLDDLWFKRTGKESPLFQSQLLQLVGLEAKRDILEDEIVDFSNVQYKFEKRDLRSFTNLSKTK